MANLEKTPAHSVIQVNLLQTMLENSREVNAQLEDVLCRAFSLSDRLGTAYDRDPALVEDYPSTPDGMVGQITATVDRNFIFLQGMRKALSELERLV